MSRGFLKDIRYAVRSLRRSPGFSTVAAVTLAIGIGATTAMFALLHAVVLSPLPYPQADRLVHVGHPVPGLNPEWKWGVSEAGFFHFLDHNQTFESVGAYSTMTLNVSGDGRAEQVPTAAISASIFDVLGARPEVGRLLTWADNESGRAPVVMLGYDFWQTRYGGDPGIVGRSIDLEGSPFEVVGVTQPGFRVPEQATAVWFPVTISRANQPVNWHRFQVIGRLAHGRTLPEAVSDLERLTAQFPEVAGAAYSVRFMDESRFAVDALPLQRHVMGDVGGVLWMLLGAVALVLLIAAVNVANLFVVRLATRRREIAVRTALGASRWEVARRFGAEALVLAGSGAVLGLGLAWAAVRLVVATEPGWIPGIAELGLGGEAVAFAVAVALLTTLAYALIPVFRRETDGLALRESVGSTASRGQLALRRSLVAAQVALAVVLLAGAGLMLETYRNLRAVDPGFEAAGVLTAQVSLPQARYGSDQAASRFWRELMDEVGALPGVVAVGATQSLPLAGGGGCSMIFADDPAAQERNTSCFASTVRVAPGYFEAMGIPVRGRTPSWTDTENQVGEAVISQAVADRLWPGEDPIGKGIKGNSSNPPFYTIVGVAGPVRAMGLTEPPIERVYFPMIAVEGAQLWGPPTGMTLVVKQRGGDPTALTPAIRSTIQRMDATVPMQNARAMEEVVAASIARTSFVMILLGTAALMALLIGLVGLYGVVSYVVEQRRGEIGIRMALGADGRRVAGMVLGQAAALAAVGVAVGVVAALLATRVMESLLYDVRAADPWVLGGVAVLLMAVALFASWVPARRASRVDPITALKAE
jgi:putative ABC transport system permease protein